MNDGRTARRRSKRTPPPQEGSRPARAGTAQGSASANGGGEAAATVSLRNGSPTPSGLGAPQAATLEHGAAAQTATPAPDVAAPRKRQRDPLLAAICHDLRAPLAAVTMGTHFVLQTTQRDAPESRSVKILEAMLRSCTQMERLIRNFADLSEVESDAVELRVGLHDAGQMLEFVGEAMKETARARSVTLEIIKPEAPITLTCDRDRLLRAIGHVVENAASYSPEGGAVTLSVARENGEVAFRVVDRGSGLAPEVLANLFDRHWHARRANRVGAGLGVAIARGFVAAHDGRIEVQSTPGEETTFTLRVPKDGATQPH